MQRTGFLLLWLLALSTAGSAFAAAAPAATEAEKNATAAAAAVQGGGAVAGAGAEITPADRRDLIEALVDHILERLNVPQSDENTPVHFAVAGCLVLAAFLLRTALTRLIFSRLRRVTARTSTTFDDKLLPALEPPLATFIMLVGVVAALKVLKLPDRLQAPMENGATIAFSIVVFWGLLRSVGALLDHAGEVARQRQLGVAAFMPWIKRSVLVLFVAVGVLMIIQSLGFNVTAVLSGLGLGGLAFALAAQDTLANVFGSIVVAIDQPFKIGEAVKIGNQSGVVEDIGLRSTRIRMPDKSLAIIPNKMVAAEPIINQSRYTQRRVEHVIGLTYDTRPGEMEAIVDEFRRIIQGDPDVEAASAMVYFRDYSPSSLDIWIAYNTLSPDFQKHLEVRQRINLALMRAVEAAKLDFAFPTQTVLVRRAADEPPAPGNPPAA